MNKSVQLRRKFFKEFQNSPEYQILLDRQQGGCKICGRPPLKNRLSIDHDHEADRVKINLSKCENKGWRARAAYRGEYVEALGFSRSQAWKIVKTILFRRSIRGLLCFLCNGGIQHFEDSKAPLKPAERFDAAAKYFRDFEGSFDGTTG